MPDNLANEVMMQLFVTGPTWDGNLVSKRERDELFEAGLIERYEGWQWLNEKGMKVALTADVSKWADQRWHNKQKLRLIMRALWYKIRIFFSWKIIWCSDTWIYEENSITKERRAIRLRDSCYQPVAWDWLEGGKIIDRYSSFPNVPRSPENTSYKPPSGTPPKTIPK